MWLFVAGMCGAEGAGAVPSPRLLPEPDHLYDHHSSEEELEVTTLTTAPLLNVSNKHPLTLF